MGAAEWLAAGALSLLIALWLLAIAIESWRPR
jgi:hypothetical protein